jgi:Transglycosylase SLT domain
MTPDQHYCLSLIEEKNAALFGGWFDPAAVMAIIGGDEDRDWDLRPKPRFEPRLQESSYGVMQVLASTARQFGFSGAPEELTRPSLSIEYGMRYLRWGWEYLARNLDREPSEEEWIGGYNAGYAAAANGRWDGAYVDRWRASRDFWRAQILLMGEVHE